MKPAKSIIMPATGTLLLCLAAPSQAAPVVWDNGGSGVLFSTPENWVGDVAPVSGVDDVTIASGVGDAYLDGAFEIGSGKTMLATGNAVLRPTSTGSLTVKTGGTLDFTNGVLAQDTGGVITFEAGATATIWRFFDHANQDTKWIADSSGVTVIEVTTNLFFHAGEFIIDLTDYDLGNGDTVVFADHAGYSDQGGTFTVLGVSGYSIDTAYDQGGGDLALAVTNIVPEPSSLALLALGGLAMVRRRR